MQLVHILGTNVQGAGWVLHSEGRLCRGIAWEQACTLVKRMRICFIRCQKPADLLDEGL